MNVLYFGLLQLPDLGLFLLPINEVVFCHCVFQYPQICATAKDKDDFEAKALDIALPKGPSFCAWCFLSVSERVFEEHWASCPANTFTLPLTLRARRPDPDKTHEHIRTYLI